MRITNTMMTNNTMRNVNKSKTNLFNTEQQMSTQKKIDKPSDDPIVAIRALSLRTSLAEIDQYLSKNVPDANSWLEITETSMDNLDGILSDVYQYCNQGSTDSFTLTDRQAIIDAIKQLKDAYYAEGNSDFSGRYIFTGYRTDSSLTFLNDTEADLKYNITQNFTAKDFTTTKYMKRSVDPNNIGAISAANTPEAEEFHRMRLAYAACAENGATVTIDGVQATTQCMTSDQFEQFISGGGQIPNGTAYYISDLGEVIFGDALYDSIMRNESEVSINYNKDSFKKGDVKPEHYFDCTDLTNDISYTFNPNQSIEYTVNFSQTLRVNTQADNVLSYNVGRDIDDLCNSLKQVKEVEDKLAKLKEIKSSNRYPDSTIDSMIEATNKELDYAKDAMEKLFAKNMTNMKAHQATVSEELSDLGSRSVRLTLTKSRLTQQQTTFRDLKSSNEDVELEDVAIEFSAAETVYQAAIATASKSVRQSLLDYL